MDLVKMLHDGELSPEEARNRLDEALDQFRAGNEQLDWANKVGLSEQEKTAYAQGACLTDIAILRYEGWPSVCSKCGKPIYYKEYGWWFDGDQTGTPNLRHIQCPL